MKIKKIISIIFLLTTIFSIFWAYQIFADVKDFTGKIGNSNNLFLLEKNGAIVCGFAASLSEKGSEPTLLTMQDTTQLTAKGYQNLSAEYYKTFVFNDKMFQDLPSTVKIGNQSFDKETFVSLFDADDVFTAIIEAKAQQGEIPNTPSAKATARENMLKSASVQDQTALKGMLLAASMQNVMEQNKVYLFLAIKDGKLKVYPETPFFSAIKMLPRSTIEQIASKAGE